MNKVARSCFNLIELQKMRGLWKNSWRGNKAISRYYKDDAKAFVSLFERVTGKMFKEGIEYKDTDFVKFEMAINRLGSDMEKGGPVNSIVKWTFLSEALASKNPTAHKFYKNLRVSNNFQRRHHQEMTSSYNKIMKSLFHAGDVFALSELSGRQLRKELERREIEYTSAFHKESGNRDLLKDQLTHVVKFIEKEGSVFEDFRLLVEGETNIRKIQEKYGNEKWTNTYGNELRGAVKEWKNIQRDSKHLLLKGIEQVMQTVTLKFGETGKGKAINKRYKDIHKSLKDAKGGYMPHYILDMIQETAVLKESLNKVDPYDTRTVDNLILKIDEISINLSNRLKQKGQDSNEYFSRNPALYITRYINDVARFNFNSYMDKIYVESMRELMVAGTSDKLYLDQRDSGVVQDGVQKTAIAFADLISDLHSVATQGVEMNETTRKMVRIITSLEFTSKMGFSARGAMRNGTQSLQNFVYFSHKVRKNGKEWLKGSSKNKSIVDEEMAKHGLLFEDISKVTEGAISEYDMNKDFNVDYMDGQLSYNQETKMLDKVVSVTTKAADISSVFTKWVENYNRKSTFKIAFTDMYRRLERLPEFDTTKYEGKKNQEQLIEADNQKMRKLAGNHAATAVEKIHFEYSPWAKSKWHRSAAGSITGQFQHYALAFINFQANIVRDAGRSIQAGDWTSPEIGRTVRLAALYGLGAGFSAMFNAGFTQLLENDTYERGKHLYSYFFGDEDAKEEAFFGKGPLIGTFAGPLPSDIITWINIGLVNSGSDMLENMSEVTQVLTGLQDWTDLSNEEMMQRGKRTLSPALTRFQEGLVPAIVSQGSLAKAFLIETSLYPQKWTSDWHKKIWGWSSAVGLTPPGTRQEKKKKKKKKRARSDSYKKALQALEKAG